MRKQKDDMQVNVAGIRRNIKNLAHNYSDAQIKVREATSNDPWGPSATIMAEIADLTYNVVAFSEIMQMIWKRLNDHGKNWRHVYKALILLDYLIKTGTEKVAQQCKENIFAIQTLREFIYFEEGKDQGNNVRDKAKQLVILLKDDERLKNERTKALKAKERFAQNASGFGSDGYIEGPTHRETPTSWQDTEPKTAAEIEFVRPQTAGEEELQLQLAMAMSREEAEQEEAKRRSDDVRLQLALSQSEQDFNTTSPKSSRRLDDQSKQSHLMDLLDISLGATNISNPPPLGAGAAGGSDPWGTPARAASQLSDPWSGTTSPQLDAWQPALNNKQLPGAVGVTPDTWLAQRTQSPPSVTSGSSNEGWLQNNAINGNSTNLEPWLNENNPNPIGFIVPQQQSSAVVDPWLGKVSQDKPDDPWLPKSQRADPWAPAPNEKRPSPLGALTSPISDLDDFDVITNRNKTGSLDYSTGSNNNNSSFLDEMDPLSTKKPLKTPQSFLGENSALVNLDNLIKPIISNNIAPAPYNPFSDSSSIPPKTNLFQQQTPAVPSINQLKQQQPFAVSINQDPWAPNNTVNATAQYQYLIDYDSDQITVCTTNNNLCNERTNNNNNNINNILCNNDNNKNQLYYLNGTNNYNNNNNSINSFYGYQKNPNDTNNVFGNYFINGNSNNNDPWYNSNNYFSSYNINSNYCKNNNNNMPWLKSEPASSNPFLS